MSQHYSNPKRESDPHALPDIEVFQQEESCLVCGAYRDDDGACDACIEDYNEDYDLTTGPRACEHVGKWYWQACFPGCLPDGESHGPFETEAEALADARDGYEEE